MVAAAQDQALRTRYYEHNIVHRVVSPTYHLLCSEGLETVDHVVASCDVLAWHRWTTLINTIRWPQLSTGTFVAIWEFQWREACTGIILIGLWRRTASL